MTPLVVAAAVLGLFLLFTRDSGNGGVVTSTTQPPPLAAIETELIDLVRDNRHTHEWEVAESTPTGLVNDFLQTTSLSLAVGSENGDAQIWSSGSGAEWREISNLQLPTNENSTINHVADHGDDLVALGSVGDGTGVWTASVVSSWVYAGRAEEMGTTPIDDLAAGPELLAVSMADDVVSAWMSSDGLEWRTLGPLRDLDGVAVMGIAATADYYFAYGSLVPDDPEDLGQPVVLRSPDGVAWEAAGDWSSHRGMIADLAADQGRLLAVASITGADGARVAVWESTDAESWTQLGGNSPSLGTAQVEIEVLSTHPGSDQTAQLEVEGKLVDVTVGSILRTTAGEWWVREILDESIVLVSGRATMSLPANGATTLEARPWPRRIVAEGERILVLGHMAGGGFRSPAMWTSADGGATWATQPLPGPAAENYFAGLRGPRVIALGVAGETMTWRTAWDTEPAATAATATVTSWLTAVAGHDAEAMSATLTPEMDVGRNVVFQVPSLGDENMQWWDPETGLLDPGLVGETADYLAATNAFLAVGDCSSNVRLGKSDVVNVNCTYTAYSTLLDLFEASANLGQARAVVQDGTITSLYLEPSPSRQMWKTLGREIARADAVANPPPDDHTPEPHTIEFDAASGVEHIAVAETYLSGMFRPGETRIVATALGTMEWTWIESINADVRWLTTVSWTEFGFLGIGYDDRGSDSTVSVWLSADGESWEQIEAPDGVDAIWEMHPFADGVIGQSWIEETPGLAYFDGEHWSTIKIEGVAPAEEDSFLRTAVGADHVYVYAGRRDEAGQVIKTAALIDTNLDVTNVEPLPADSYRADSVGVAPTDTGFMLVATDSNNRNHLGVWTTHDGQDWSPITVHNPIEHLRSVWDIRRHGSQYFASGMSDDTRCVETLDGDQCGMWPGVWRSADGATWTELATRSGEPIASASIGSGPLGLVSVEQNLVDPSVPRGIFVSSDGTAWEEIDTLRLFTFAGGWWWTSTPAVGPETIVIPGSRYFDTSSGGPTDQPFMLIGRLVGP